MLRPHALLPEDVGQSLPWPRHGLGSLQLPSGCKVPERALQRRQSDRSLLMRSCKMALVDQVATLSKLSRAIALDAEVVQQELVELRKLGREREHEPKPQT